MVTLQERKPLVSIVCNVFNHAMYLERTLEGFVNQKTDFDFEVLVHDDCSTDGSVDIIKRYEKEFPDIVYPIYQKENQYSKGKFASYHFQYPRAKGKYIAFCEGDDWWIDEFKLQKQVDYLEHNPDCKICFTNGIIHNVQSGKDRQFLPCCKSEEALIKKDGVYDAGELSLLSFIPTCSFVFPKSNLSEVPKSFYTKAFGGDRKMSLFFAALGYAYMLDECTCQYNYAVPGSALTRDRTKEEYVQIEHSFLKIYELVNQFTDMKYRESFLVASIPNLKNIYYWTKGKPELTDEELAFLSSHLTMCDRIKKLLFSLMSDQTFNQIRKIKKRYFDN